MNKKERDEARDKFLATRVSLKFDSEDLKHGPDLSFLEEPHYRSYASCFVTVSKNVFKFQWSDRDGIGNEYSCYFSRPEEMTLLEACDYVKKIVADTGVTRVLLFILENSEEENIVGHHMYDVLTGPWYALDVHAVSVAG